jgi:acyl-CoA reductase-like NAD-dependent aldehyde dehydrogenase
MAITVQQMLIDGNWVDARSGDVIDVENPATKTIFATVPAGEKADVDIAVEAASRALPAWAATSPKARAKALSAVARRIDEECETIARTISTENGNALRTQSRGEVTTAADMFHYMGGLTRELKGTSPYLGQGTLDYTRREPIGVVGAIVPWNAPVVLAAQKIAPALCAGNTIVLKASEVAPLGVLKLAEICNEFLPAGTVNVITGFGPECGAPLAQHPQVRKVTFTGSTAVGRSILVAAAQRIAPVSLELGGKSAQIVFPDVEPEAIAQGIINAMRFTRQGQSCTAGSRLFVHEKVADAVLDAVTARLQKLVVGNPLDESSDIGAIVSERQFNRVCSYIESAQESKSDSIVLGGLPPTEGPLSEGYFVNPTIVFGLPDDAKANTEEIFGPVMSVATWTDEHDVVARANNSEYGLAGYVWANDSAAALRVAHRLQAGWIQVNQGGGQLIGQSYGGIKQSGIGRELSLEGMLEGFTSTKQVSVNIA